MIIGPIETIENCLQDCYEEFLEMADFLRSKSDMDRFQALSLLLIYFREKIYEEKKDDAS